MSWEVTGCAVMFDVAPLSSPFLFLLLFLFGCVCHEMSSGFKEKTKQNAKPTLEAFWGGGFFHFLRF